MKGRSLSLIAGLSFWACTVAPAQVPGLKPESPVSFGGYIKYLAQYGIPREGNNTFDHQVNNRINLEIRGPADLAFALGMRNRLFFGDRLDIPRFDELVALDIGTWDLSWNWLNEDDALGNTTLDRLYLDWEPGEWLTRLGRQRVNWGMVNVWNPNDLFNSYSYFDFDYEERPGTDAFLVERSLGFASSADAVWGFGDTWDETSLAARYLFNTSGYDIQVLGGKNRFDLVAGGGFRGSVGGAALRGEASHFEPYLDAFDERELEPATVAALETDYSIASRRNVSWGASVLYTSNPEDPGNTLIFLNQPLTARTLSFARWTGQGSLGFDITPLSRQNLGAVVYDDGSWFITADNTISLSNDWDLLLLWQHFDGRSGSLFGANPLDLLFARLRWSF